MQKTITKSCKKCGKEESLTHDKTYKYPSATIHVWRDHRGRYWNGNHCHACSLSRSRKHMGFGARGSSKNPKSTATKVAVRAERRAAKFFESLGFKVEIGHGAGPDLFCDLGPWTYTVEVKLAGKNGSRWRVGRVMEARKRDDLVAMVLPNGRVYIDSMEHHLSKCVPSDGTRSIWPIVKEFGLKPLTA
jgi:hypothetical protein